MQTFSSHLQRENYSHSLILGVVLLSTAFFLKVRIHKSTGHDWGNIRAVARATFGLLLVKSNMSDLRLRDLGFTTTHIPLWLGEQNQTADAEICDKVVSSQFDQVYGLPSPFHSTAGLRFT